MPQGDKTGPQGSGPMTGRKNGNCANAGNTFSGFGMRRGSSSGRMARGRGFGYSNRMMEMDINTDEKNEKEISSLKNRLAVLEDLLKKNKLDE